MPKPKPNCTRERRIIDEIVVDTYDEEEHATGRYCLGWTCHFGPGSFVPTLR